MSWQDTKNEKQMVELERRVHELEQENEKLWQQVKHLEYKLGSSEAGNLFEYGSFRDRVVIQM